MSLVPVAMYGLEVPPGELLTPAAPDFPATFRITMAAIDPTEPADLDPEAGVTVPRATLKVIRRPLDLDNFSDSEDEDEDSEDEALRELLAESSDDESDEEENGGPSDPTKSKKALKQAALAELIAAVKEDGESDEEMEDAGKQVTKKGKAPAIDSDEDEDSDIDIDEDDEVEEFVICTLDPEKHYQQTLDIVIGEKEEVFFTVTGSHTVYLTGNYMVADDGHNHHHEVYDSESESDEEGDYDLSPDEDELELDEEDESDELDDIADPRIAEVESDEEEEEVPALVIKPEKSENKGKNKRAAEESLDDLVAAAKAQEGGEKPSKKQLKKQKIAENKAAATKEEDSKDAKKVQFAAKLEQGPTGSAAPVASTQANGKPAAGVRTVKGVKIEDKKTGSGPAAKNGDKVSMRYIGKTTDGKVFDSNKKGKPFQFKLGRGEVIQGWDVGVAGMQIGGERRLTIPASMAYGSKSQPGIPANSVLVFDIKCLEIK